MDRSKTTTEKKKNMSQVLWPLGKVLHDRQTFEMEVEADTYTILAILYFCDFEKRFTAGISYNKLFTMIFLAFITGCGHVNRPLVLPATTPRAQSYNPRME